MADHDEEDLFADLYENDDAPSAAPAAAPPAPAAPAEPEHPAGSEQTDSVPVAAEPASVPDPIANGSNGAATYDQNQQDSYGNGYEQESHDQNMQGGQNYDYNNNNQGNDYGAPQNQQQHHQEEDYKPIGIKEDGKMFIGGLNWETTDQSLRDYFSQFGEVVECTVMRDGATGRSRGFGFLTFRDPKTVNIVMVKEHQLDGKIIDPKRAIPRDEQERTSKIFVGGVSQEATEQDFKNFFMQFGRVLDATLMMDKDTGRPRGFGFVTFDSEAAVDRTLERPLEILGKYIEVKKAQPRGNIRDDNEGGNGRFNKHNKFAGNNAGAVQGGGFNGGGSMGDQGGQGMGGANGMSPAMMAQYWQRMQQYFQVMQQQMAANMGGGGGMNPMMGGGQPNPAMMQQMMAMQNGGMGRGGPGGGQDPNQMNPAMMQQMQQMQQMQAMQNGGNNNNSGTPIPSGPAASASPMNGGPGARPGYTAQEQMAFEQQKYERQQSARMGSQTSWEGMYDEVPAPGGGGVVNQGGMGGGQAGHQAGGGYRGGRGGRGRGGMHHGAGAGNMTPQGPAQAPINAPTGPKNAGKPGANYRGGGRGGGHRGFHPYGRGGGQ